MPRRPQRTQDFSGSYSPEAAAIHDARKDFSSWLVASAKDEHILDEMIVVLSELMAHAIDASDEPAGDVTVQAWVDAGGLTLKVTNLPASTFSSVNRWNYDDPLRACGRGLLIVESLAEDIAVAPPSGPEPLSIRCRRELPGTP